uniref:PK_C domain-containing protein n=1 Tax=Macrostomum lignano TaxID=282301 RepID=A0A1I8FAB0_9PLAT
MESASVGIALDTKGPRDSHRPDRGLWDSRSGAGSGASQLRSPLTLRLLRTAQRTLFGLIIRILLSLLVKEIRDNSLLCEVENGGKLGSKKGVNLPAVACGPAGGIRHILGEAGKNIKNYCQKLKITKAFDALTRLWRAADGINASPADPGARSPTLLTPVLDGAATASCCPARPPKATFPLEAVRTMHQVCREARASAMYTPVRLFEDLKASCREPDAELARFIVITTTGKSAQLVARHTATLPILTVSRLAQTCRQAASVARPAPAFFDETRSDQWTEDMDKRIEFAIAYGRQRGFINRGDFVVMVTAGRPAPLHQHLLRVIQVTEDGEGPASVAGPRPRRSEYLPAIFD